VLVIVDSGLSSTIEFKNNCGHISKTILSSLLQRKQFDLCFSCQRTINHNFPSEILSNIIGYDGQKYSHRDIVEYFNPGCKHISKVKFGHLIRRESFDFCPKCPKPKTYDEYVSEISDDITRKITKIGEDKGRFTIVKVQYDCGCEKEIQLHAILQNKKVSCNCIPVNRLSEKEMIDNLSYYLSDPKIISGFPGNRTTIVSGLCKKCESKVESRYFNLQMFYKYHKEISCNNCSDKNIQQKEVADFIRKLGVEVEENNHSIVKFDSNRYKEVDIVCKRENLCIEYNGLLWHCEKYKSDKKYHYKKTKACLDAGFNLLHIWSDKYLKGPEIYQSIISVKLGLVKNKIHARKTVVKFLEPKEFRGFLNDNHIDGNTNCIGGFGLFYENELVSVMSLRKVSPQNKKYLGYIEIARFATKKNCIVVGGESKLLDKVESFANQNKLGGILNYVSCDFGGIPKPKWKFTYQGLTDISYFYTDGSRRFSRQRLQNRNGESEAELAQKLGWYRVFGTPNMIYSFQVTGDKA
jgi:hypothetical protein